MSDGVVRLVAAPAGGALFAVAGFSVLVWVDVATYLVPALVAWVSGAVTVLGGVAVSRRAGSSRPASPSRTSGSTPGR